MVTTIHSPSASCYARFDRALLLVRHVGVGQGSVAYYGTVPQSLAYFADLGFRLSPHVNPAEFQIEV